MLQLGRACRAILPLSAPTHRLLSYSLIFLRAIPLYRRPGQRRNWRAGRGGTAVSERRDRWPADRRVPSCPGSSGASGNRCAEREQEWAPAHLAIAALAQQGRLRTAEKAQGCLLGAYQFPAMRGAPCLARWARLPAHSRLARQMTHEAGSGAAWGESEEVRSGAWHATAPAKRPELTARPPPAHRLPRLPSWWLSSRRRRP